MPSVPATAERMSSAAAALPMTTTGEPPPAGKCAASTSAPTTESGLLTNACAAVSPLAFMPVAVNATAPRITAVTIHTSLARLATALPTRAHSPPLVGSALPNAGRAGQKIHRPKITSSAGSRVSIASSPMPMPIALTGPSPLVGSISATTMQSMPAATVAALATMAGPARCRACAIASCRSL